LVNTECPQSAAHFVRPIVFSAEAARERDLSVGRRTVPNMSSILASDRDLERTIVGEALDHLNAACKEIDALSVHALTRSELHEVLCRLDAGERRLATAQQRLLGRMVATQTASPPRFDPAAVLARRLRISPAEARKRIADAGQTSD
jgi:hypothetical protein